MAEVEREFLNITTSKVTAEIFKYWNLSEKLIKMIEYVDDIEFCEEDYKRKAQILDVVKTICNVCNTFCEENIEMGLQKAREYNLDVEALNSAINVLKGRFNGEGIKMILNRNTFFRIFSRKKVLKQRKIKFSDRLNKTIKVT